MIRRLFPPLCLFLAIAMCVVGFSMLAFGGPEASVDLHQARASGDELAETTLEQDLNQRQNQRVTMIVLLFVGSGIMTIVGFGSMHGSSDNRN